MRKKLKNLKPEQYKYHTGSNWIQTYKEIPPLAKDLDTGEIINLSTKTKIVEAEKEDIQAHIQSFAEDQDIKNIIRRIEAGSKEQTGRTGEYGDIDNLPDNYADLVKYAGKLNKKLADYETAMKKQKERPKEEEIKDAKPTSNE